MLETKGEIRSRWWLKSVAPQRSSYPRQSRGQRTIGVHDANDISDAHFCDVVWFAIDDGVIDNDPFRVGLVLLDLDKLTLDFLAAKNFNFDVTVNEFLEFFHLQIVFVVEAVDRLEVIGDNGRHLVARSVEGLLHTLSCSTTCWTSLLQAFLERLGCLGMLMSWVFVEVDTLTLKKEKRFSKN